MSTTEAKHNVEDENGEQSQSQPQNEKDKPSTDKPNGTTNDILIKLHNILEGVSSQEADLLHKTHKLEEWCQLHRDALDIAQQTKQQLIDFEVVDEDDTEQEKCSKQQRKTQINDNLDKLEQYLKKISWREKKYRCRDCIEGEGELQHKYTILRTKSDELIAKHESMAQQMSEYKERETAHRALMLKWQAQKEKKNGKINELSLAIERLEFDNERLQETSALNAIQMTQKEQMISELESKCAQMQQMKGEKTVLEAKLKVSIKEIIKLRGAVKDKDEHKTVLLTKLSEVSSNLRNARNEMELLNDEYLAKFKAFSSHLNDVHSKLESFSVTIRNFSGNALKSAFDTELEARVKSNEELPAWKENIKVQLQRATQQITIQTLITTNNYIKESETHIAHINLTALQLLHEYTSLLIQYNHLYIANNNNQSTDHSNHNSINKMLFQ
eukprot:163830_1